MADAGLELPRTAVTDALNRFTRWVGWGAVGLTLALALLTVILVILRKTAGWGSIALEELRWHCYGAAFLLAMATTLAEDGHVRVDILSSRFPRRVRLGLEIAGMWLIALPACFIIVWFSVETTWDKFQLGEASDQPGGLPYRWIIWSMIPFGFALLGLQTIARGLLALLAFRRPQAVSDDAAP